MNESFPTEPLPPEGLSFDMAELRKALRWAADRPGVRLLVAADHRYVQEALEICPPGKKPPRWCIWRDHEGRIHLDDWATPEYDLPYHTLAAALAYIETNL